MQSLNDSAPPASARPSFHFQAFRRVVIKVGSSLLIDSKEGQLRRPWLDSLIEDLALFHKQKVDVLVVSSGSIALGRRVLHLPSHKTLRLEDSQAAAAVGQIALARVWAEALAHHNMVAGQILVTLQDTEERQRYLNARETMERLLHRRAIPVINENDTVATQEIRYGDNDRLAARVATMVGADLLILLSDVEGLYSESPHANKNATFISHVPHITPEIENMAGGPLSLFSKGGMRTKIEAAKIATQGGTSMIIADGRVPHSIRRLQEGARYTWFSTHSNPITARKKWIAGSLEPRGTLFIDDGAFQAVLKGASLLPAGLQRIEGEFSRGDCVILRRLGGADVGRGLVAYESGELLLIKGQRSEQIEKILGRPGSPEIIHRDDMALRENHQRLH